MDTLYIILKNITVTGANAEQNAYIVGPPAPLGFLSFADAIAFQAAKNGVEMKTRWVLPIYHRMNSKNINSGFLKREISPSLPKKATANDLLSPSGRDQKSMTLHFSAVLAFTVDSFDYTLENKFSQIKAAIPNRILGGTTFINFNDEEHVYVGRDSGWRGHIPLSLLENSHILRHRVDIAQRSQTIDDLIKLTSLSKKTLSPIAIGYQQISPKQVRSGQRSREHNHVFVDPLISAAEWRFATSIRDQDVQVWVKKTQNDIFYTDSIQEQYA